MTPANTRRKMLAIALAVGLLAAVPLALAAPGGRGGEHAPERAAEGMAKASASRSNATAEADGDDNETRAARHGADDAPGHARNHSGLHKGFAKAMLHVPDFVKAFFERVLAGAHPSSAKLANLE